MPNPTNLSFLGVAKEATKGTGVAATNYIPVKTYDPTDDVMYFEDTGLRGAMATVFNEVQGPVFSNHAMTGDVFPDTIPWLLTNVLGDITVTGASAPFTHAVAVKNAGDGQPGALTLSDFYSLTGVHTRQFAGCQVSDVTLKWTGDGMFEWSASAVGFGSTLVAKPTQSFTTIPPSPGWLGTLTLGGSSKTFMESGELTISRPVNPIHTVDGTQAPYAIWCGPVSVSGKVLFVLEDDTELLRYLNGTTVVMVLDWNTGAGAAQVETKATMSKVQYTVANIKRGKDFIELEVDFVAIANTTDVGATGGYSPIKLTMLNALPAGTYA